MSNSKSISSAITAILNRLKKGLSLNLGGKRRRISRLLPVILVLVLSCSCATNKLLPTGDDAVEEYSETRSQAIELDEVSDATVTVTTTGTFTPAPTATITITPSPTATNSPTITMTPTETATPSITPTPSDTPTPRPTNTPKPTGTPKPTNTTEPTITSAPTAIPQPSNTPVPPPAPIGARVTITKVDKRDEYVVIYNSGDTAQDLNGWRLVSEKGNQVCGLYGSINPGQSITVYAMASDADKGGINCGFGSNIWNNSEPDPAVLYDPSGHEVSRY